MVKVGNTITIDNIITIGNIIDEINSNWGSVKKVTARSKPGRYNLTVEWTTSCPGNLNVYKQDRENHWYIHQVDIH